MPLKHHTETAYIVFLALVTAASGFIASLLPHIPTGLVAWSICMTIATLYPLVLTRTFRENRADYEFRALHWFPAIIFGLWIVFEYVGSKVWMLHILQLGFFFLWSLPLVALAIALLIIFSLHVIRRRVPRIFLLSLVLVFFSIGAVLAEAWNVNPRLQRAVFAPSGSMFASARHMGSTLIASVKSLVLTPRNSDLGSDATNNSSDALSSSLSSVAIDDLQMSSSFPPVIAERKPHGLSASGPEDVAVLFLSLLAVYSITLHLRARRRLSFEDVLS